EVLMKKFAFASVTLLGLAGARAEVEHLGDSGTTVVSGQLALTASNLGATPGGWSLSLTPGADIVVAHGLTLGCAVDLEVSWFDLGNAGSVGLTPRIGWIWHLAPRVALWPRVAVGYQHFFGHLGASPEGDVDMNAESALAEVPVTVELAPHMFLSMG